MKTLTTSAIELFVTLSIVGYFAAATIALAV